LKPHAGIANSRLVSIKNSCAVSTMPWQQSAECRICSRWYIDSCAGRWSDGFRMPSFLQYQAMTSWFMRSFTSVAIQSVGKSGDNGRTVPLFATDHETKASHAEDAETTEKNRAKHPSRVTGFIATVSSSRVLHHGSRVTASTPHPSRDLARQWPPPVLSPPEPEG